MDRSTRNRWFLAASLTAGAFAVVAACAWYYMAGRNQLASEAWKNLQAIAAVKSRQIASWRAERLGDGNVVRASEPVLDSIRAVLDGSTGAPAARSRLLQLFNAIRREYGYANIALLDSSGSLRLSVAPVAANAAWLRAANASDPSDHAFLTDLSRYPATGSVYMTVWTPVPGGALVMCIDPNQFLFPLVQSWPTPSRTAETLLIRRERDTIVFLNDLRHVRDAALKLRKPFTDPANAAIRALSNPEGVSAGIDYRGEPVLAAVARVPGSDWFVVGKVDRREVEAPSTGLAWELGVILALVLSAKAAALTFLWRDQQLAFERQREQDQLERKALLGHFGDLARHANDIILLLDESAHIVEANQRAEEAYGYSVSELHGMRITRLMALEFRGGFDQRWEQIGLADGRRFESIHLRKDGSPFEVEVSARAVNTDGHSFRQEIIRDISERKHAERELRRMNRALRVLSECNSAIVHAASEPDLLNRVCHVAVGPGGYKIAWVGMLDSDAEGTIRPVAVAGDDAGYVEQTGIAVFDPKRGSGPVGRAVRQGEPVICKDILNDAAMAPWRDAARERGFASVAVFPVRVDDRTEGTLAIYAAEPDAFDEAEIRLLSEMAEDLAFGMGALRREAARRESEARFRTVFDSIGDAIFIHDLDGRTLDVNAVASERLGYSRSELMAMRPQDVEDEVNAAEANRRITATQTNGELLFNTVHVCKGGSRVTVEVNSKRIDYRGQPAIVSVARDRSERLRAQSDLDRSHSKLVEAQSLAKIGDWEMEAPCGGGPRRLRCSREVYRMLELPADRNPTFEMLESRVHPDDWEGVKQAFDRAFEHAQPFELEHRLICAAGGVRWIRQRAAFHPQAPAGSQVLSGTMQDITEYRKLEEQFQQSQKLESIGRLAGGIAHDFNNLLTVINGYSRLLAQDVDQRDPMYDQLVEIERAGSRAADLTAQLLAFSRKQVIEPKVIDMNAVIREVQSLLGRLVGERIELVFSLDGEAPHVLLDRSQMHQVLMNLAVNARDAMPEGGRVIVETSLVSMNDLATASHLEMRAGDYVLVSVSDNGTGMDEAVRQHIFEPFFTTKKAGVGTGLGLSTVYGIVKQSGGWIGVYSEPGRGTSFKIYFPRVDRRAEVEAAPAPQTELRGKETILVVEDQPEVRKLAAAGLRSYGYRVLEGENAGAALLVCEQHTSDIALMLTDVVMPGMLGTELAVRLSGLRPAMKVLYMSGYTAEAIMRDGVLSSGVSYLPKPFTSEALAAKVRQTLESPQQVIPVLIADDDDAVRAFLGGILSSAGYRVFQASNGKQAMERLKRERIDLLITDLVMPEQEGIETVQTLHRERPDLKIIAISGAFGGSFLRTARVLGAHATLAKPVSADDLLRTVRELLQERTIA